MSTKDAFTLSGKPFDKRKMPHLNKTIYTVSFGLFFVSITEHGDDSVYWSFALTMARDSFRPFGDDHPATSKECARDAAEIELRRIVRECFEIAGEMEATSGELLEPAYVRFAER